MKTNIHYTAKGQNAHTNSQGKTVTTETHFNGALSHVGHLSDESAKNLATKHAKKRGLDLKEVRYVFHV